MAWFTDFWFSDFYRAAVGKKAVMAITGIILFGFILIHMVGNLHLYEGSHEVVVDGQRQMVPYIDEYGTFLRQVGAPAIPPHVALWVARLVLLAAVFLHMWAAWQVTRMSNDARPSRYEYRQAIHTTYASRTMRWGGVIILLFVIFHILHFTTGTVHPDFVKHVEPNGIEVVDVYHNVVTGFQPRYWYVSLFYIVAQVALGFHLYHGLWSLFQSLGWNHPRFNSWRNGFAHAFAWIVTLGNISFPVAVLTGLVR
ncbi:MAG TPA: succinate dehydrogenase cytochrome b subunit [Thermoanaerobaculia bacterium]|nr:succinate dehydrogenase cytochrome b subunit [Thermoanaerobaculia bacterium]